ncbi:hypothetical protein Gotur_034917 [Gossypium turneri]
MDVFIPEEYVIRRRFEKKEAAIAEERSNMVVKASQRNEVETKSLPLLLYGSAGTNGLVASAFFQQSLQLMAIGGRTRPAPPTPGAET